MVAVGTTAWWSEYLAKYPSDTIVRFVGGAMCFEDPDGRVLKPLPTNTEA